MKQRPREIGQLVLMLPARSERLVGSTVTEILSVPRQPLTPRFAVQILRSAELVTLVTVGLEFVHDEPEISKAPTVMSLMASLKVAVTAVGTPV
jgi:hypothetical protein